MSPTRRPTRIPTEQETLGRRGRSITDSDANAINRVEELSYDLKVHEVMPANLKIASPEMPLSEVLEILRINHISGVPVMQGNDLIGILSLEDIVRAMQKMSFEPESVNI
jgi:CBS domain-containing protein